MNLQSFSRNAKSLKEMTYAAYEQYADYYEWHFKTHISAIRITLALSIFLTLFFYPFDPLVLETSRADSLQHVRLLYVAVLLTAAAATFIKPNILVYYVCYASLYFFAGLVFIAAGLNNSQTGLFYCTIALAQTLFFLQVTSRVPFWISFPLALAVFIGFAFQYQDYAILDVAAAVGGIGSMVLLLGLATYQRDKTTYKLFLEEDKLTKAKAQQAQWMNTIGRILKHELGNQVVGLSSSMQMYGATNPSGVRNEAYTNFFTQIDALKALLENLDTISNIDFEHTIKAEHSVCLKDAFSNAITKQNKSFGRELIKPDKAQQNHTIGLKIKGDEVLIETGFALLMSIATGLSNRFYNDTNRPVYLSRILKRDAHYALQLKCIPNSDIDRKMLEVIINELHRDFAFISFTKIFNLHQVQITTNEKNLTLSIDVPHDLLEKPR